MSFSVSMQLISALLWILAYILMIIKGFKDKTYSMPFIALCLNFTWEFTFSFVYKTDFLHQLICFIWFLLDCIILTTFLLYGYKIFKSKYCIKKTYFYILSFISLVFSFIFIYLSCNDFAILFGGDIFLSAGFIAYGQNLIMSILFVVMILNRKNLSGQSIYIATLKWLGTLCVGILKFCGIMPSNHTELFLICLIQLFDILYIYLIFKHKVIFKNCKNY